MHRLQLRRLIVSSMLAASFAAAADPSVWKVAPAPPASWQRDRVADLTARRKAVEQQIGD